MPIVWKVLFWIEILNQSSGLYISRYELDYLYDVATFGNSPFLLRLKPRQSLFVLKTKQNDGDWKEKYFFVKRNSIPGGDSLPKT